MKFGHYWPKGPQRIEHLRPAPAWPSPERTTFSVMPILRFEPFDVGPREKTRDERASLAHETLFGSPLLP